MPAKKTPVPAEERLKSLAEYTLPSDRRSSAGTPRPLEHRLRLAQERKLGAQSTLCDNDEFINVALDARTVELRDANQTIADLRGKLAESHRLANERRDTERRDEVISRLTGERDQAKKTVAKQADNIARLESFCGVRGVNPKAAPPTLESGPNGSGSGHVYDQWQAATGGHKTALFNKHREAIRMEAARRASAGKH